MSEETYYNPVDGLSYQAEWKTCSPEGGVAPQHGSVINSGIRLLCSDQDMARNIHVRELAAYIKDIQALLESQRRIMAACGTILLQIEISKEQCPEFSMFYEGAIDEAFFEGFCEKLDTLEDYRAHTDQVTLQVEFTMAANS